MYTNADREMLQYCIWQCLDYWHDDLLSGVLYRKVSPLVLWKISKLDGTHTGVVVLYCGFGEQARHEHMSDEYKDRYIISALLKTPPRYYRQYKTP